MNYSPIERIAAKLPEAPFYITDMEFPIIVENVYEALKDFRMLPLKRTFKDYLVTDYEINIGAHYMVHSVVRINSTSSTTTVAASLAEVNQVIFKEASETIVQTADLDTTQLDTIKRYIPHIIGEYVDYNQSGNCLTFKETDFTVGVEYNELLVDSKSGYPLVPENAETACLWFVAFQHYLGEYMAGRLDGNRMQFAEIKLNEARKSAKADHRMSKNQIDKLLNTMVSFDRKSFGWSA